MAFKKVASRKYAKKVFKKISYGYQETTICWGDSNSLSIYCHQISRTSKRQRPHYCGNRKMLTVLAGETWQKIPKYAFIWKRATSIYIEEPWGGFCHSHDKNIGLLDVYIDESRR